MGTNRNSIQVLKDNWEDVLRIADLAQVLAAIEACNFYAALLVFRYVRRYSQSYWDSRKKCVSQVESYSKADERVSLNQISDYSDVFADYSVCITVENGWTLKEGDQFIIDVSLYEQQSITLEIGYILDGKYYELSNMWSSDFREILNVEKDGDYYFCITNRSSANAVIESGNIKARIVEDKKKKEKEEVK